MEILKAELVEDGAKRDRRGHRITPPERIDALVREYHASGLTQAAFARRAGVNYSTFAGWVFARRRQAMEQTGRSSGVRFAQLQLPGANPVVAEVSVTLTDGTVVRGADVQAVALLVRALKG